MSNPAYSNPVNLQLSVQLATDPQQYAGPYEDLWQLNNAVRSIMRYINSVENGIAWGNIAGTITDQTDLMALLNDKIEEAPEDGTPYARQDAGWVPVSAGGGGIQSIVPGTGIAVDNTDPDNPVVSATGGGGSGDPYISRVQALLSFDGISGSTNIIDATRRIWTATGGAQLSSAQSRFGGTSLFLSGALNTYISATTINLTGDFTLEGWIYPTSYTDVRGVFYSGSLASNAGRLQIEISTGGIISIYSPEISTVNIPTAIPLNSWSYIAFTKQGTIIRGFLNGNLEVTTSVATAQSSQFPQPVYIGVVRTASVNKYFVGYIDEFRVTEGFARYTSSFTAPSSPFPTP